MLTPKKIAALKPREKRFVVADGHGLTLRVYPSGSKTWVLRLCTLGRVSDVKLGSYPEMSLKEARQITRQKKKELGQEPPKGYVFADAFRIWQKPSGVFSTSGRSAYEATQNALASSYSVNLSLYASNSNSRYGSSSTVQPAALRLLAIIKA